jgi:hypothetical protein
MTAHRALAPRTALALLAAFAVFALVAAVLPARAGAAQTAAVQAHLLWARYDSAAVSRQLDQAKQAGAGMVRVDLGWASLEVDGKGRYSAWYLAKIDHVVKQAEERGIKVLFTLWETPCWASTAPDTLKQGCAGAWWDRDVQRYPPANASDYADALAYLTKRYGRRVAAWEIWNEPNHSDYFKASDKVASYAALVKAAYPAAKAADPGATIIAGSLADADYEFTEALYAHGVKGNFDAWSVHPYSEDRSPLHPGISGWEKKSFVSGVPRVRDTMLRQGDDKPIWLTEFGWSTCTVRGLQAYRNCVDPEVQARYLQLAFKQMQAFSSYVPVGVWFNLQDTGSDLGDRLDNYGLLSFNGAEKPAFSAFRASAEAIDAGQVAPAPVGPAPVGPAPVGTAPLAPAPVETPPVGPAPAGLAPVGTAHDSAPTSEGAASDLSRSGSGAGDEDGTGARDINGQIVLRAIRGSGRVTILGSLPVGKTLHVRAYPWKRQDGRFSRSTRYRKLIRVSSSGRFRHRIRLAAVGRGRWKIVVMGRRQPRLQASAVIR